MIPKYPGKFITLEGIDGCGKTTQAELLENFLREKGYDVLRSREPGGDPYSELLRKVLKFKDERDQITGVEDTKVSKRAELFSFLAARANYIDYILKPALETEDKIVISDRFIDSTYAYQGYGNRHNLRLITIANRYATEGLRPDITFLIDIDPEKGLENVKGKKDTFELRGPSYIKDVRNGYLKLQRLDPQRIKLIPYLPGNPEKMHELIREHAIDVLSTIRDFRFYFAVKIFGKSLEDPTRKSAKRIVSSLKNFGRVLSEQFTRDDAYEYDGREEKLGVNVFERDMAWIEQSDAFCCDYGKSPSTGIGREMQYAHDLGMPRICFYNEEIVKHPDDFSRALAHDKELMFVPYTFGNIEDKVKSTIEKILKS